LASRAFCNSAGEKKCATILSEPRAVSIAISGLPGLLA
jgi:hypothetical protein